VQTTDAPATVLPKDAPPDAGSRLALAFVTIGRALKSRAAGGVDELWAAMLLHHVAANGSMRLSDLACGVGLDASTVSRHVKSLEDSGKLARLDDPKDRRACRLELTPAGRAALERAMAARASLFATAVADWSDDDRQTLISLMTRLADTLGRGGSRKEAR
jgi:DNA-binding MarR family transcriptional regulator